jgi:glucokinase
MPTKADAGFEPALERLIAELQVRVPRAGLSFAQLRGVGIGCAGPVDPARGLINNPFTLGGWNRCDIVTPLRERLGLPVRLENDADVAALGEAAYGAGRGAHSVVMLTLGTGVGGGVILANQIYRGARGEHPELGHLLVPGEGPECYCGTRGCLESLASGTALGAAGQADGFADARAVFAAADTGDPAAVALIARAVDALAAAAWTLCHTFLPERLVLGGGIMEDRFHAFAPTVRSRLAKATQFSPANVEVRQAALGNDAGLAGAAALWFSPFAERTELPA